MEPWEYLKEWVKATDADDLFVQACWAEAEALVSDFVGTASVPAEVYTRAIEETGANLFQRRRNQNGIAGFDGQSTPVFVAKDPMNTVYPLLARYVGRF